ncbi:dihydrolipoamide acetyltransferase family protein [Salinicoccus albus]|uniref:dihydrolipoamide acetyltransferase family protein n=1 Tax=Salinicoccus albus TaxID=418756 RepID=UPI000381E252|nr:dihydrolipoamide acetyltransferase family protein [Salinicoccus albus]
MEEILMPKLGESVTEGTIENWLVKPGDRVEEYDALCEVITDKVTAEVPSVLDGTIGELLVSEGDTIEVGTPICTLETDGTSGKETSTDEPVESEPEQTGQAIKAVQQAKEGRKSKQNAAKGTRISPVVMRLANEHNIDLGTVEGSGIEGRITKKDIQKVIEGDFSAKSQMTPAPQSDDIGEKREISAGEEIPVTGVRKAIADKMSYSAQEIPHAWLMMETDATNLVNVRNRYKTSFRENEGYNLTFFSFFVKAVAETLKEHPMLNSSWQGDKIVINKDINISIAVAGDDKLYVPVIKNADELSIKGIARKISELADLGRKHQLTTRHMEGGTFTVNNTGAFGSVESMGIINHPQSAILQVESIVKRPVVIDDMIAIRHMVNLCLSIDHRVLDGLAAGEFLSAVKQRIENYSVETTSIY